MVFSSLIFIFTFLPLLLIIFFITPKKFRNYILLLASLLFYSWGEGLFIIVLLMSIFVNYLIAVLICKPKKFQARTYLVIGVIYNISLLVILKYTSFLIGNINWVLKLFDLSIFPIVNIHMPIGISFFTFKALAYIIDVYRKDVKEELSLLSVAIYISLFTGIMAGPIDRFKGIIGSLKEKIYSSDYFYEGISRFIIGLGKKVLIANTLGTRADQIFALTVNQLNTGTAWLGITCYTLQIYFDFSGYTDMAVGIGKMFGINMMENFNYPYISTSFREFWRRWHISLSTWFRDYLYIPMGGNRTSKMREHLNLFLVFFLCGLWHGSTWNFVIWGVYHGMFLIMERGFVGTWLENRSRIFRHLYLLIFVMIGWVFFRSDNLSASINYLKAMAGLIKGNSSVMQYFNIELIIALIAGILFSMPVYNKINIIRNYLWNKWVNTPKYFYADLAIRFSLSLVYIGIMVLSIIVLSSGTYNPFIYFQF